jgi:DNA-binding transcriptional ArsR family regulator
VGYAPLQFYTAWPALGGEEEGLQELEQTVAEWKPRLVVIDTLARAYDSRIEWNSVSEATAALAALQRLAHDHECCVLTVDHHKKPGLVSNAIDDILGSTGKAAVIDTAWGLYKDRSKGSAILRVTGRDIDTCELALRFSGVSHCWGLRPVEDRSSRVSQEARVTQALEELGRVGTTAEIAERTGMEESNVSRALRKLMAAGSARRLPRNGYRVPYELVR